MGSKRKGKKKENNSPNKRFAKQILNNPWAIALFATLISGLVLMSLSNMKQSRFEQQAIEEKINLVFTYLDMEDFEVALQMLNDLEREVSKRKYPEEYAAIKYMKGICLLENKDSINLAVNELNESLNIILTLKKNHYMCALVSRDLGRAYYEKSKVRNKKENLLKAIELFEFAVSVDEFAADFKQFFGTNIDIGRAYNELALIENREENSTKAIRYLELATSAFSLENSPIIYAEIMISLADAYSSQHEEEYFYKAIDKIEKALQVYDLENYPQDYYRAQNSLGVVYIELYLTTEDIQYLYKSINLLEESLNDIRDAFSYGTTQANMAVVYLNLYLETNEKKYLFDSLEANNEALKIMTIDKYPLHHAHIRGRLGVAFHELAHTENKQENYKKSKTNFEEALKIFTPETYPNYHETYSTELERLLSCEEIFPLN